MCLDLLKFKVEICIQCTPIYCTYISISFAVEKYNYHYIFESALFLQDRACIIPCLTVLDAMCIYCMHAFIQCSTQCTTNTSTCMLLGNICHDVRLRLPTCSLVVVKVVLGLALLKRAHSMTQNSEKAKGQAPVNSELFSELHRRPMCTIPLK